jgi:hypothetical protein
MKLPIGMKILIAFFAVAPLISTVAGISLLLPGSFLDKMWELKKADYATMHTYAIPIGLVLLVLGAAMTATFFGLIGRKRWALWSAIVIIGANGISDAASAIAQHKLENLAGVLIAGLIVWYLFGAFRYLDRGNIFHNKRSPL